MRRRVRIRSQQRLELDEQSLQALTRERRSVWPVRTRPLAVSRLHNELTAGEGLRLRRGCLIPRAQAPWIFPGSHERSLREAASFYAFCGLSHKGANRDMVGQN